MMPASTICPHCGTEHTATSIVAPSYVRPQEGDATLCVRCGEWCVFDDRNGGGLRKPTRRELREMMRDSRCLALRECWDDIHATRQ